jgi:site-specific DNA-methyltransferase (adenine-specific)
MEYKLILGDCLIKLKELEDNSIDSIVTDPPYGISFMGQKWDYSVPSVDIWKECYRVLKPGGHLLSFSGSRTYHRMAVNIEDAGFEIRDQIMWVYGSGFPKSLNVGKAIDKKLGNEREIVGIKNRPAISTNNSNDGWKRPSHYNEDGTHKTTMNITVPASEEAKQWDGWGTALKPAHEPIVLARKPFKGTVADNVLEHGTGALNIDGCRVGDELITVKGKGNLWLENGTYEERTGENVLGVNKTHTGRYPANFIHDGLEEEWSKYFYCPKANKKDRNEGCEDLEEKQYSSDGRETPTETAHQRNKSVSSNNHPTVKPTELMRYLCRLITPKDGTVLDPFMGSGSTGKAAVLEGFSFIGVELSEEYLEIAKNRIKLSLLFINANDKTS